MAADDAVEPRLRTILDRVDGWLKFAEAKNAGLIALSGAATSALMSFLRATSDIPHGVVLLLTAAEIAILCSLILAISSFLPRLDDLPLLTGRRRAQPTADTDNLYFYGDLQKYTASQLAAAVASRYASIAHYDPAHHPLHSDLAAQIVVNARIAHLKFRSFAWSAACVMLAAGLVAAGLVLRLVAVG